MDDQDQVNQDRIRARWYNDRISELKWYIIGYRSACADTFEKECPIKEDHLAALDEAMLAMLPPSGIGE